MKNTILTVASVLSFLIAPAPAFALFNVNQGGTGASVFSTGAFLFGNGTNPLGATYSPSFSFVNATTTNATSTFAGNVDVLGNFAVEDSDTSFSALRVDGQRHMVIVKVDFALPHNWGSILLMDPDNSTSWATIGSTDAGVGHIGLASAGFNSGTADLDLTALVGSSQTYKFPINSGTFGLLEANQKWTGANTFDQGAVGTTTVNFGHMASSTSHVCFNTKNTDGQDISFFFVGTSMVVENNACQ